MYPSPEMIRLVDKKFGGELNKADVMGVEVGCGIHIQDRSGMDPG